MDKKAALQARSQGGSQGSYEPPLGKNYSKNMHFEKRPPPWKKLATGLYIMSNSWIIHPK